jgi:hypothetical protein
LLVYGTKVNIINTIKTLKKFVLFFFLKKKKKKKKKKEEEEEEEEVKCKGWPNHPMGWFGHPNL